nr:MAG TPA: hypothetical protein [Caudoviricetes sp.]
MPLNVIINFLGQKYKQSLYFARIIETFFIFISNIFYK